MRIKRIESRAQNQNKIKRCARLFLQTALLFVASFVINFPVNAQCAMCRAAIESEGNTAKAEAINDGIIYLMLIPYLLVAAIGYAIFRMYKKR